MSEVHETDIAVIGGGIAGQIAAVAFAQAGYKTIGVDPAPKSNAESDLRSTAFLQPARQMLENIGVWASLADHATPLQSMRLMDRARGENTSKEFDANEISALPFAWNLPNATIRRELSTVMGRQDNLTLFAGRRLERLLCRTNGALIKLDNGQRFAAKLVIGADGRNSTVREAADISVKTTKFDQMALAFAVFHTLPHDNSSTEIHRSGGPFTLVPLPDQNGRHRSAVVWMETAENARLLSTLPEDEFNTVMNDRAGGILGELCLDGGRGIWPMIAQIAERLTAPSVALVAEAAHVVPPIGAQGLNMSLADISALLTLAEHHPLGSDAMLKAYENQRYGDISRRVKGVTLLNRASINGQPIIQAARAAGLSLLHGVKPIRHGLMRMGLGQNSG